MNYTLELNFRKDPINAFLTLFLYFLLLFIIYQLVKKILGHSWQLDVITLTLVVGLIINEARKERRWGEFVGEMREFKSNMMEFKAEMRDFQKGMRDFKSTSTKEFSRINHQLFGDKA